MAPVCYGIMAPFNNEYMYVLTIWMVALFIFASLASAEFVIKVTVIDVCMVLWGGLCVVHIFASPYRVCFGSEILQFCCIVAVYIIARVGLIGERMFVAGMFFGAMIQSGLAMMQCIGIVQSNNFSFGVTGSFLNPGHLGGYLAVCWCVIVTAIYKSYCSRWLWMAVVVIMVGMVLAQSRAAVMSCVVWGVFLAYRRLVPSGVSKIAVWSVAIVGILAALGILYCFRPESADSRLFIWRVCLGMISDSPMFGKGLGAFQWEYMLYQADYIRAHILDSGLAEIADNVISPFSEPIHIMIEYGVIGMMIFAVPIVIVCKHIISSHYISPAEAGLVALGVFGLFSYPTQIFPLLILFPMLWGMFPKNSKHKFSKGIEMKKYIVVALSFFSVLCLYAWSDLCRLDSGVTKLYEKREAGILSDPHWQDYITIKDLAESWICRQSAENYGNYDCLTCVFPSCEGYCAKGKYYESVGREEDALYCYQTAANMVPSRIKPKFYKWQLLRKLGRRHEAECLAMEILTMQPKIENSFTMGVRGRIRREICDEMDKEQI